MKITKNKIKADAVIPAKPDFDTEIVAADEIEDSEYLDLLTTEIENVLNSQGYDVTVDIEEDSIRVMFEEDSESNGTWYLQPIDEIVPNFDDIREDADTIAQAAIDELRSSDATEDIDDDVEPIMSAFHPTEEYQKELEDRIKGEIFGRTKNLKGVVFESDKDNLYITVTVDDEGEPVVKEYTVPFVDLTLDEELVDKDINYVLETIYDDLENIMSATTVEAAEEVWTEIAHKQVPDSDGFMTDYTLYENKSGTLFIAMFGDNELYEPDPQYADFECDDYDEAMEWFNSYDGFAEDFEDEYYDDDYHLQYSEEEDIIEGSYTGRHDPLDVDYMIRKAIKGDKRCIDKLISEGYTVRELSNPLQSAEVGTFEIIDPDNNVYNYDNTLSHYSRSAQDLESEYVMECDGKVTEDSNEGIYCAKEFNVDDICHKLDQFAKQITVDAENEREVAKLLNSKGIAYMIDDSRPGKSKFKIKYEDKVYSSSDGSYQKIYVFGDTLEQYLDRLEKLTKWKVDRDSIHPSDIEEFYITAYSYGTGDEVELEIKVTPTIGKNGKVIDYGTFLSTDVKVVG